MNKLPLDNDLEHEGYRTRIPAEEIEKLKELAVKKRAEKTHQSTEPVPIPLLYNIDEEEALDEAMAELEIFELD